MLAEPAHWCSGLGILLLNERARVQTWFDGLFIVCFFSSEIF